MKKTLSMLLAGAMLAAALTGCGSSASTGSDSADNSTDSSASGAAFKLGGTGPLTGAAAIYGNACHQRRTDRGRRAQRLKAAIFSIELNYAGRRGRRREGR